MTDPHPFAPLEISAQYYKKLLEEKSPCTLLDIREPWELKKARLTPSLYIRMEDLIENIEKIPHNHPVVILCHHGVRSLKACYWLQKQGLMNVMSLRGGIDYWSEEIDSAIPRY